MKLKRMLVLICLSLIINTGTVLAEEGSPEKGSGYIKPTFGLGFSGFTGGGNSGGMINLALDVDFVVKNGLTFGLQNIMAWKNNVGLFNLTNFGLGYTYNANVWCIGGKLMAIPNEQLDGGIGLDVNGTYWFNEIIGITGIIDMYFGAGSVSWSCFALRVGISSKF